MPAVLCDCVECNCPPPCEISRIRVVQEQDNTNKINILYKTILYKQIV